MVAVITELANLAETAVKLQGVLKPTDSFRKQTRGCSQLIAVLAKNMVINIDKLQSKMGSLGFPQKTAIEWMPPAKHCDGNGTHLDMICHALTHMHPCVYLYMSHHSLAKKSPPGNSRKWASNNRSWAWWQSRNPSHNLCRQRQNVAELQQEPCCWVCEFAYSLVLQHGTGESPQENREQISLPCYPWEYPRVIKYGNGQFPIYKWFSHKKGIFNCHNWMVPITSYNTVSHLLWAKETSPSHEIWSQNSEAYVLQDHRLLPGQTPKM